MKNPGWTRIKNEEFSMKSAIRLLFALTALCMAVPASAATLTVNSTIDDQWSADINPGDGVCLDGNGVCSLRAAIMEANVLASPPHTIDFQAGVDLSINSDTLAGALPALAQAITIDASSVWVGGVTQRPGVRLTANLSSHNFDGIQIAADGCALYGISIGGFGGSGVMVTSAGNAIGGTTTGQRCVLGNNDGAGVSCFGAGATNNAVYGCYIGVGENGQSAWPNAQGVSLINGASNNWIGGVTLGQGNVISGNTGMGIQVYGSGTLNNRIGDNLIGLDTSYAALPNGSDGIRIYNQANGTAVGGDGSPEHPLRSNWIANNDENGVYVVNAGDGGASHRNELYSNVISSNKQCGVKVEDSNGVYLVGNTLSANVFHGVLVQANASTADGNYIYQNTIYANGGKGISLQGGANNGIACPCITSVGPGGIAGVARSAANLVPSNMVQIYSDDGREGGSFQGVAVVSGEQWSYGAVPSGPCLTVLASDHMGNTSEFGYMSESPGMVNLLLSR
jgi:parallel beta-helix repeat protein